MFHYIQSLYHLSSHQIRSGSNYHLLLLRINLFLQRKPFLFLMVPALKFPVFLLELVLIPVQKSDNRTIVFLLYLLRLFSFFMTSFLFIFKYLDHFSLDNIYKYTNIPNSCKHCCSDLYRR